MVQSCPIFPKVEVTPKTLEPNVTIPTNTSRPPTSYVMEQLTERTRVNNRPIDEQSRNQIEVRLI